MEDKTVEVGQVIYSLNSGNAARHRERKLTPMVVTEIGRKYFYVCDEEYLGTVYESRVQVQVNKETWRENTEYTSDHRFYASTREYEDEKRLNALREVLSGTFRDSWGRGSKDFSLDQLERAAEALGLEV